jgi:hypothetical protein
VGVRDILAYIDPEIATDNVAKVVAANGPGDVFGTRCALSLRCGGAIHGAIGEWIFEFPVTARKVLKAMGKI